MAGIWDYGGAGDFMSDGGGRLPDAHDAHDEVLYVIRQPEDRFARVV
jgi:hypothetical protein